MGTQAQPINRKRGGIQDFADLGAEPVQQSVGIDAFADLGAEPFTPKKPEAPKLSLRERINQTIASPNPSENRPWYERAAYGVARAGMAPINLGREVLAPAETPEEHQAGEFTSKLALAAGPGAPLFRPVLRQAGTALERIMGVPSRQLADEAGVDIAEGRPVSGLRKLFHSSIPAVGPMGEGIYQQAVEKGDVAGTATELGTGAYLGFRGPKLLRDARQAGSMAARTTGRGIQRVSQKVGLAAPTAEKAMHQAIQPSVTIPRATESVRLAGPELQRVRQARGVEIRDTGVKGEALEAHAENIIEAKRALWQEYEQRLQPFEGFYEKAHRVGRAMRDAVDQRTRRQYPAAAKAIDQRAGTYNRAMSLREIEDAIQSANNELANWYKRSAADPGTVSPNIAASKAEVAALRKLLDEKLQSLTGASTREFKQLYGALRDVEKATARQIFVQARQKGASLYEALGALAAVGDVLSGGAGAIKGMARFALGRRLAQLRNPDYLIEQAYHGKNAFPTGAARPSYTPPVGGQWMPPAPAPPAAPPGAAGAVVRPIAGQARQPRAALPPAQPPQLGPGRVIPAGPVRSTPPRPIPPREAAPPVDVSGATVQPWPKMLSVNEVRSQAAKMRQQARELQEKAGLSRIPSRKAKLTEQAQDKLARAKELDEVAAERAKRVEEADAPAKPVEAAKEQLSAEEMKVFRTLPARFGGAGASLDEILEQANLSAAQVSPMLTDLELRGIISKKPGGRYVANRAPDTVAEAAPVKPAAPAKEPWQMEYDEWAESATKGSGRGGEVGMYKAMLQGAVKEGKPVPQALVERYGLVKPSSAAPSGKGGTVRQQMSTTYRALSAEQKARVDQMVQAYKESDFWGKKNFDDGYELKRGTWLGLPIEEKLARAMKENKEI